MSEDDVKDSQPDPARTRADLDLCLTLIRKLEIQLETAINLQYLADLESLSAGQIVAFRAQLCEQLGRMAESMIRFQADRAKPRST